MLKWAVQNSRPSYLLPAAEQYEEFCETPIKLQQECQYRMKRKSSILRRCSYGADKENLCLTQLTSTPLTRASGSKAAMEADLKRVQSLKDLSNIMPDRTNTASATPVHQLPAHYASTLPTFDAEYSPCAIIPGPLLALRGLGIPDSYFEKPRYLDAGKDQVASIRLSLNESASDILEEKPLRLGNVCQNPTTTTTTTRTPTSKENYKANSHLNSTKMSDITLERMIDAILSSKSKEPRRRLKQRRRNADCTRQRQRPLTTEFDNAAASPSPTYRPAYDPASDLSEYWQPNSIDFTPLSSSQERYQRREICASSPRQQWQRQRGVRRNKQRQLARRISTSVRQSAQKLFGVTSSNTGSSRSSRTVTTAKPRNASPDSGHNSTSDDYEEK